MKLKTLGLAAAMSILGHGALASCGGPFSAFIDGLKAEAKAEGLVEDVMPQLPVETLGIYAVYPPGRFTQPKVRAFIDFLVHAFAEKGMETW